MRAGPSQEEIRRHNLGTLLRSVHVHGATSREELTSGLGLNRSTIGALTAALTAAGLVSEEVPRTAGRAGRPSLVVRPASERVYVFAFCVDVDRLTAARVGLGGVVLDRRSVPRPRGENAHDEVVAALTGCVSDMQRGIRDASTYIGSGAAVSAM